MLLNISIRPWNKKKIVTTSKLQIIKWKLFPTFLLIACMYSNTKQATCSFNMIIRETELPVVEGLYY